MTLRRTPQDFTVTERLTAAFTDALRAQPDPRARHAIYRLTKTSLTTPEAVTFLAKALQLPASSIEYAGLKDKHAHTTQHISIPLTKVQRDAAPSTITTPRAVSAQLLGWSESPINAADIDVNHFAITVRDLTPAASNLIDERTTALTLASGILLFTNYYGSQRFGSARHDHGFAARHLITGDFDTALRLLIGTPARKDTGAKRTFTRLCAQHWGDWKRLAAELPRCPERSAIESLAQGKSPREAFATLPNFLQQISLDAYQSFLWNAVAAARALQLDPASFAADDHFSPMHFPHAKSITNETRDEQIPLFSPTAHIPDHLVPATRQILTSENLSLPHFRIPEMRRPAFADTIRPLFSLAHEFMVSPPETDAFNAKRRARTCTFTLPSGSYATVLLRALGQ